VPQERRGGREKVLLETPVPVLSYGPKRLDHHEHGALRAPERLRWPGGATSTTTSARSNPFI
jgi:hypothetical protein